MIKYIIFIVYFYCVVHATATGFIPSYAHWLCPDGNGTLVEIPSESGILGQTVDTTNGWVLVHQDGDGHVHVKKQNGQELQLLPSCPSTRASFLSVVSLVTDMIRIVYPCSDTLRLSEVNLNPLEEIPDIQLTDRNNGSFWQEGNTVYYEENGKLRKLTYPSSNVAVADGTDFTPLYPGYSTTALCGGQGTVVYYVNGAIQSNVADNFDFTFTQSAPDCQIWNATVLFLQDGDLTFIYEVANRTWQLLDFAPIVANQATRYMDLMVTVNSFGLEMFVCSGLNYTITPNSTKDTVIYPHSGVTVSAIEFSQINCRQGYAEDGIYNWTLYEGTCLIGRGAVHGPGYALRNSGDLAVTYRDYYELEVYTAGGGLVLHDSTKISSVIPPDVTVDLIEFFIRTGFVTYYTLSDAYPYAFVTDTYVGNLSGVYWNRHIEGLSASGPVELSVSGNFIYRSSASVFWIFTGNDMLSSTGVIQYVASGFYESTYPVVTPGIYYWNVPFSGTTSLEWDNGVLAADYAFYENATIVESPQRGVVTIEGRNITYIPQDAEYLCPYDTFIFSLTELYFEPNKTVQVCISGTPPTDLQSVRLGESIVLPGLLSPLNPSVYFPAGVVVTGNQSVTFYANTTDPSQYGMTESIEMRNRTVVLSILQPLVIQGDSIVLNEGQGPYTFSIFSLDISDSFDARTYGVTVVRGRVTIASATTLVYTAPSSTYFTADSHGNPVGEAEYFTIRLYPVDYPSLFVEKDIRVLVKNKPTTPYVITSITKASLLAYDRFYPQLTIVDKDEGLTNVTFDVSLVPDSIAYVYLHDASPALYREVTTGCDFLEFPVCRSFQFVGSTTTINDLLANLTVVAEHDGVVVLQVDSVQITLTIGQDSLSETFSKVIFSSIVILFCVALASLFWRAFLSGPKREFYISGEKDTVVLYSARVLTVSKGKLNVIGAKRKPKKPILNKNDTLIIPNGYTVKIGPNVEVQGKDPNEQPWAIRDGGSIYVRDQGSVEIKGKDYHDLSTEVQSSV